MPLFRSFNNGEKNLLKAGDRFVCPKCAVELVCCRWEHRHYPIELEFEDDSGVTLRREHNDDESVVIEVGEERAELICPVCGSRTGVFLDDANPDDLLDAIREGKVKVERSAK